MATAYNMEFAGASIDRRTLRTAWMRHTVLSWLDEKKDLQGSVIAPLTCASILVL
jgi:hypothetical protein